MEPILLHLAIDSFAIQAERLRCPKLVGRPIALAPPDSSRPRVLVASREAVAHGVRAGMPVIAARRICRDLVPLAPDVDLYAGLSDAIRDRLLPIAPFAGAPKPGRFVLDLTGLSRTHGDACVRAARAGRDVERSFRLHPTIGVASTRLVSAIAAGVLAPDGELLDVPGGSEAAFLAPLSVSVLPAARGRLEADRLDLLSIRVVRDVQALSQAQLQAALGAKAAWSLWREARGLDGTPERATERPPSALVEETLAAETNDARILRARLARLAMELWMGIRRRGTAADRLEVGAIYADGRHGRARRTISEGLAGERAVAAAALTLMDRAVRRRVRVRRIRLAAWERPPRAEQLQLWTPSLAKPSDTLECAGSDPRAAAFDAARDRVRARLGTEALVPASWMALGVAVRPSARP